MTVTNVTPLVLNTTIPGTIVSIVTLCFTFYDRLVILTLTFLVKMNHHRCTVQSMLGCSSSICEIY